jgi:hypothetical protein
MADLIDTIFTDGIMASIGYLPIVVFLLAIALVMILVLVARVELLYAVPVAMIPFIVLLFYNFITIPYLSGAFTLVFGFMLAYALYLIILKK